MGIPGKGAHTQDNMEEDISTEDDNTEKDDIAEEQNDTVENHTSEPDDNVEVGCNKVKGGNAESRDDNKEGVDFAFIETSPSMKVLFRVRNDYFSERCTDRARHFNKKTEAIKFSNSANTIYVNLVTYCLFLIPYSATQFLITYSLFHIHYLTARKI